MINHQHPDFHDLPGRRAKPSLYEQAGLNGVAADVSIITPYYNTAAIFIETAISLFNQSLQNWQWVIVDDGSTDEASIAQLKAVAESDPRILLIRQANAGPAAARNTAVRHSTGRYLCMLDSDDMVEPTYLDKCIWFLESNPAFAFCNAYSVVFGDQEFLWSNGFDSGAGHLQANSGPPISVIRRQAFLDCGGFDETIRLGHEDWDFWLAMANAGHWGYTLPEYLQWYRKSLHGRFEQIMRLANTNEEFERYIQSKYSGVAGRFPTPKRRQPLPFEDIETASPVTNPLQPANKPRRIMFLIPWMVTGGADQVNLDLIAGLVAKGYEVTVCASLPAAHEWMYRFTQLTPDVFVLPTFLSQSDYPRFLAYLIASRGIDTVLISGSTLGYLMLPYLRASSPRVSFVDMCHVEEPHWQNGGHPRFAVGYQDALELNIVTTAHLADWMVSRGADRSRIRVLYTGVGERGQAELLAERKTIRGELGLAEDLPVIIFAGRICEQKRPALLAGILAATRDAGLQFHALILGEGDQRTLFEDLIAENQLQSCISMLGFVAHERWLSLLAAADVFLLPSAYEGISVALLEAMAAGVVPVASRVGGQTELIEAGAGFLIPHDDEECAHYADTLMTLFSSSELRKATGENAQAIISRRFSKQATLSSLEAMLEESRLLVQTAPRQMPAAGLAKELATFALEYNRLSGAVDWLWGHWVRQNENPPPPHEPLPPEALAVARLAVVANNTNLGRMVLRNRLLRWLGRKLLARQNRQESLPTRSNS